MMYDYSQRYPSASIAKKNALAKKVSANGLWGRTTGILVSAALCLGIVGSVWLNRQINSNLANLSKEMDVQSSLSAKQLTYLSMRQKLRSEEKLTQKASMLGLFLPAREQVRRP